MKKIIVLFVIGLFLAGYSLTAGVYIKTVDIHGDEQKENSSELFIGPDRIRVQLDKTEEYSVIIFRHDKQVMWMINEQKKTYTEMTKEDVENLKKQMDNAQAMMAEQLKNVPEEQRKMMEEMMKNQMQQMQSANKMKIEYKPAGQEKIDKWKCTKYEGYTNDTKNSDIWAASWKEIGYSANDFQGLKYMGEFFEVLSEQADEFYNFETFNGIPVQIYEYDNGKVSTKTNIKEISTRNFDASLFNLPAGLTKKKLPLGGGMDQEEM
jgi:hypothetical protein